jgi:hypothetical protein
MTCASNKELDCPPEISTGKVKVIFESKLVLMKVELLSVNVKLPRLMLSAPLVVAMPLGCPKVLPEKDRSVTAAWLEVAGQVDALKQPNVLEVANLTSSAPHRQESRSKRKTVR